MSEIINEPKPEFDDFSNVKVFRHVILEPLQDMLDTCYFMDLNEREMLLKPRELNKNMYLIHSGRLRVHLDRPENPPLVFLGAGECVGELSSIESHRTSAYVVAEEDTRLIVVPQNILWSLIDTSHEFAKNLLYTLSNRVRYSNDMVLASIRERQLYEYYANVDALTGLRNRRWLDEFFVRYTERSKKEEASFSILMMDIDNFKQYNDSHGHQAGDQALATLARIISTQVRPADAAVRYGGEEFLVLLPDRDFGEALVVAERLRETTSEAKVKSIGGEPLPSITISVGIAVLKKEDTPDTLLASADAALYRAKEKGRNCVSE